MRLESADFIEPAANDSAIRSNVVELQPVMFVRASEDLAQREAFM